MAREVELIGKMVRTAEIVAPIAGLAVVTWSAIRLEALGSNVSFGKLKFDAEADWGVEDDDGQPAVPRRENAGRSVVVPHGGSVVVPVLVNGVQDNLDENDLLVDDSRVKQSVEGVARSRFAVVKFGRSGFVKLDARRTWRKILKGAVRASWWSGSDKI